MNSWTKSLPVLAIGMLLGSASSASTVLPGYSWTGECQSVAAPANSGCSESNGPSLGTAQFGLNAANGPFVSVSDSTTNGIALGTDGELIYYVEVAGPSSSATVDVSYLLSVSAQVPGSLGNDESVSINAGAAFQVGPYNVANASVNVTDFGGSSENGYPPSLTDNSVNATYNAQNHSWSGRVAGPEVLTLTTGVSYEVVLRAQAACNAQNVGNDILSCSAAASIDPTFAIDSSQSNAGQYAFSFSPGIGNGSATPEPATLGMAGALLAAIGVGRRARRKECKR